MAEKLRKLPLGERVKIINSAVRTAQVLTMRDDELADMIHSAAMHRDRWSTEIELGVDSELRSRKERNWGIWDARLEGYRAEESGRMIDKEMGIDFKLGSKNEDILIDPINGVWGEIK